MFSPFGRRLPVAESGLPWRSDRVRQMTCTAEEFRRALVAAFGAAVSRTPNGLLLAGRDASLTFALREQPLLRLAALQLARLRVEIDVHAGDDLAAQDLLAQVDRATLRGGG